MLRIIIATLHYATQLTCVWLTSKRIGQPREQPIQCITLGLNLLSLRCELRIVLHVHMSCCRDGNSILTAWTHDPT